MGLTLTIIFEIALPPIQIATFSFSYSTFLFFFFFCIMEFFFYLTDTVDSLNVDTLSLPTKTLHIF